MGSETARHRKAHITASQSTTTPPTPSEGSAHTHPSKRLTDLHRGAAATRGAPVAALGGGRGC